MMVKAMHWLKSAAQCATSWNAVSGIQIMGASQGLPAVLPGMPGGGALVFELQREVVTLSYNHQCFF
jgi:hypothetical protein